MSQSQTLKLNAAGLPIEIIPWQAAIELWIKEKAVIIESFDTVIKAGWRCVDLPAKIQKDVIKIYDDKLDSWQSAMYMPAVIRMVEFIKPSKKFSIYKPFNRLNVWLRDGGRCQYCNKEVSKNDFEYEHVIPQSRGGLCSWTNIVCSCHDCNSKKRNRTPEEAGMILLRKPFAPVIANSYNENIIQKFRTLKNINIDEWRQYIYWNVELEE
jgi:5-methylcytosine-specific restriction endonuclease McrA